MQSLRVLTANKIKAQKINPMYTKVKHQKRSLGYNHVPTIDIVDTLKSKGFIVATDWQSRVQSEAKQGYQKHWISLYHKDFESVNGIQPRLIVKNSHYGDQSLQFQLGVYRIICSNGLVVADEVFKELRLRHDAKDFERQLNENLDGILVAFTDIIERVTRLSNTPLSFLEQRSLARIMLETKGIKVGQVFNWTDVIDQLLEPQRIEDSSIDLFTVFNRVQERLSKGFKVPVFKTRINKDTGIEERYIGQKTLKAFRSAYSETKTQSQLWAQMESIYSKVS